MKSDPTECELCRWAEMTRWERLAEKVGRVMGVNQTDRILRSAGNLWTAYRGGWYERHRRDFVETGDPVELKRMLRHF